jgi:hypothetical protein
MPEMGHYVKAYPVERFREFPGWGSLAHEPADHPYLYLQENYVVTGGIFQDEEIVFDSITGEWIAFCKERLAFEVPAYGPATASGGGA